MKFYFQRFYLKSIRPSESFALNVNIYKGHFGLPVSVTMSRSKWVTFLKIYQNKVLNNYVEYSVCIV